MTKEQARMADVAVIKATAYRLLSEAEALQVSFGLEDDYVTGLKGSVTIILGDCDNMKTLLIGRIRSEQMIAAEEKSKTDPSKDAS